MKVLFLQDVRPTARAGDVKEVKDGFARNYLLPNGLAALATRVELQKAEKLRKAAEERRVREAMEWREIAAGIAESPVEIEARSGPTGRLYGSVTNAMIAEKVAEMIGREVDRRSIRIPEPIRTTGNYVIHARFPGDVEARLQILVKSDSEEPDDDAESAQDEGETAEESEESPADDDSSAPVDVAV